jgi:hypothetical protein
MTNALTGGDQPRRMGDSDRKGKTPSMNEPGACVQLTLRVASTQPNVMEYSHYGIQTPRK